MLNLQTDIYTLMKLTRHIAAFVMALLTTIVFIGCNEKSSMAEEVTNYSNVSVTSFYLKANSKVMANLDSVFFSIDMQRGLIFNTDSLPKGTDVSKIIPMVTCADNVKEVIFDMEGGAVRTGQSNYITHPSDSIDFTGRVTMRVTSADGSNTRLYEIKVNVHQTNPDSLAWGSVAMSKLPARMPSPKNQKCVDFAGKPLTLIAEADGTFTLSRATAPDAEWEVRQVSFDFIPDVRSLVASSDALFMLDNSGRLMTSQDGLSWTDTGCKWTSLMGAYQNMALGLKADTDGLHYDSYPSSPEFVGSKADPAFPVSGTSQFILISNKWMDRPIGLLFGGRAADGSLSSSTWGFDGSEWANLTETAPVALESASLVPYFMKKRSSAVWIYEEYSVLLIFGGRNSSGELSRKTYISYDTGITWEEAPVSLFIPDYIPSFRAADCIVATTRMSQNFEPKGWKSAPEVRLPAGAIRKSFSTNGYVESWDCPYIYMFGGTDNEGKLHDTIWRGVINRLTYRPIF